MVNETKKDLSELRVIAIKLPFDLQERILAFPFLHSLRELYPQAEMHFISPRKDIEVLNLLPLRAFYHEFDENELVSIFDVHRYSVNAKIFNVDLYISLTNSFADAVLGWSLNAKQRLGFGDGWKTIFFNQKINRLPGHHLCEDFFGLFKQHIQAEMSTKVKVLSRELEPIITEDFSPFFAVNLTPLRELVIAPEWLEFIGKLDGQNIVFFSTEDHDRIQLLIQPFLARLPKTNNYQIFFNKNWIDLGKMFAQARGVVTYNGPASSVAAYVGCKTVTIFDQEDPQRYGPFYFLSESLVIGNGQAHQRERLNVDELVSKTFDFFKLFISH
jgi:ADP-heptose:LPS heptosyltransferase